MASPKHRLSFDVDIDGPTSLDPAQIFENIVKASIVTKGELTPHPCGVYLQAVPVDPVTGLSAIPYAEAEEVGAFKIDFLHLTIYDKFETREQIKELIKVDPDWTLLQIPSVVQELFQLSKHLELLKQVKPTSMLEVADCLALIRPQKRYMLASYIKNPGVIRPMLYSDDGSGYRFKKAHAICYAMVIILQLHLIKAGIT